MTTIELIALKYALAPIAVCGFIAAALNLKLAAQDLRLLDDLQINGGKRLATIGRLQQSAFLLAAFSVFVLVGVVFWLTPTLDREFYQKPQVMTERLGFDVGTLLLVIKEFVIRRKRAMQEEYYDQVFTRRSTDAKTKGTGPC